MLALVLAAGIVHPNLEGRVSLLEARQMLESQQVWQLRADLPSDAVKVLNDVQLHVQHDQEQEDKVRELTQTVSALEARLAALELVLQQATAVESTRIPVAPMQMQALEVKPQAKKTPAKKRKQVKASARVAEAP